MNAHTVCRHPVNASADMALDPDNIDHEEELHV
jgi:hypothetical protein